MLEDNDPSHEQKFSTLFRAAGEALSYSLRAMMFFILTAFFTSLTHAKNLDLAPLPPKVLYHFGQKKNL